MVSDHRSEYEKRIEEEMRRRMRGKSLQEIEEMIRNTGGRVVEGGSSRWVVFDNGTIVSGSYEIYNLTNPFFFHDAKNFLFSSWSN